ncbi:hypothetical protein BV22DRAFT_1191253 [Leucogyrophana mollusca]|uniref:Uncharacterized protein n=1 Tax=Leucogyrophana mollusca TaxID=85980 RepID=A0ACB8BYV8_9AGAM|nr:hypothetical protein BV22DRAFT_1191253 [Leucogyrophana mollusca]
MSVTAGAEKKGHVCPPSNATHPADRWESLFVYSFICKFTHLRAKVEGLETPMDFENALLTHGPDSMLSKILQQFILNLRPQTRNLSADQISTTLTSVLADAFKSSERTIFWDDDLKANVDPFIGLEGGIFAADWDLKLKVLRQLVELQLSHSIDVKNTIDRAWGVMQNKHKKRDPETAPPGAGDAKSQESLQLIPLGQDTQRKRYWIADGPWVPLAYFLFHLFQPRFRAQRMVFAPIWGHIASFSFLWPRVLPPNPPFTFTADADSVTDLFLGSILDSPRIYVSTNPWKITATFQTVSSTREEYMATIDNLKAIAPPPEQKKLSKLEVAHQALVRALEARVEIIDAEIARVQKVRRKIEQRQILMAQVEIRETRTRRQTRRPDYVYNDVDSDQDDADEYKFEEDNDYGDDEQFAEDDFLNFRDRPNGRRAPATAQRRSSRATKGKRPSPDLAAYEWRGERRSSRLGAPEDDPPRKRARTEESTTSSTSLGWASSSAAPVASSNGNGTKPKVNGAAAVKPTEIAVEQVGGKKKSKFWFYAVEPIPGPPGLGAGAAHGDMVPSVANGHPQNGDAGGDAGPSGNGHMMAVDRSMEGSLSPAPSIES